MAAVTSSEYNHSEAGYITILTHRLLRQRLLRVFRMEY